MSRSEPGRSTWNVRERARAGSALADEARRFGVVVSEAQLEALLRYAELVEAWTARVDLTGARDAAAFLAEHVADALPLLAHVPEGARVADVGSGAGLPGVPLAVLRPDVAVVLVEPRERRWAFLREAVRELHLAHAEVRRERLDALAQREAGRFDVAVSRATWPAAEWLGLGAGLVRTGGCVLALEGPEPATLPERAERHPYDLAGRRRAVVSWRPEE